MTPVTLITTSIRRGVRDAPVTLFSEAKNIAARFVSARRQATGLPDYPGPKPADLDQAYAVQKAAIDLQGDAISGWKVGRIFPPLSDQYGAERLAGPIFAGTVALAGAPGLVFAEGFGAAEAEFLVQIGEAPNRPAGTLTLEDAAGAIAAIHIGIEIASSPFAGINDHGPAVTVSDFGNNNGLIVGPEITNWKSSGFEEIEIATIINGRTIGTGKASVFPHGVLGSVRFLLDNLASRGIAVPAGCWISSGAVTGVHKVQPGDEVLANFGRLGSVTCRIEAQSPQGA
jgi:2-keto-4-pentenoate hydratase